MRIIIFLFRFSKRTVSAAILIGVISGIGSALLMALINKRLGTTGQSIPMLAWGFTTLVALVMITNLGSRLLLNHLADQVTYELRLGLCRQILDAPLRHLEETGAPRILAVLLQDINSITSAVLVVPAFCINLTVVAGCMIYLGWLSPGVLASLTAFLVIAVVSMQRIQQNGLRSLTRAREEWDKLIEHFRALTEGTKELKLHRRRREAFLTDILQATALAYRRHDNRGKTIYAIGSSWSHILYFVFIGFILFILPDLGKVSLATLSGFTITALYIRAPVTILLEAYPMFKRANIALNKVEELGLSLKNLGQQEVTEATAVTDPSWARIDLLGVTHEFYHERDDQKFVLGPIDLSFSPGELVFVVGGNGSGKTTLAKVLTGLYSPGGGEILWNGEPVTDANRDNYRQNFSVVFSDFYLFEQLIGLDSPQLGSQATEYLTKLQLHKKVAINDGQLSTIDLSRGQRKRLALLTAYLEDRPIYVLDEWAADQDRIFRDVFYLQLLAELKARGKTVIAITHDDHYYHLADRIIKLNEGQLEYDRMSLPHDSAHGVPVAV